MSLSRPVLLCVVATVGLAALLVHLSPPMSPGREPDSRYEANGPYPSDWFGLQRAFPNATIPQQRFREAVTQARLERQTAALSTSASLVWTQAGPYNIGGRVTALASVPGGVTVYLGAANGGVFKSTNSGVNWTPIFDDFGVYSIGALALEPGGSDVLYVGTGEANASVDSYDGAGVFRTSNGGTSWEFLGLTETARIARIAIDPQNSNRLFVAAMGKQFSTGPDRGLYRSLDRGATWSKVLFVNDSTGVTDVVINPAHPDTMYCATWERLRRNTYRRAFGPGCGVWRSADGGSTWTRLSTGLPVPSDDVGRIALAVAPTRPSTVYASIGTGAALGYRGLGMYRSLDGGTTWVKRGDITFTNNFGGFVWYFGDIAVSPENPDWVYSLGQGLIRSTDGGASFVSILAGAHVDEHALWIDPSNTFHIYLGSDGGFFSSIGGGGSWQKSLDLPITQFYAGAVDAANPNRLVGGTQDNNTVLTAGSPSGWNSILGGDGFYALIDHTNPNVVFAEFQFCCSGSGPQRSTSGGGGMVGPSGFVPTDRYNWCAPYVMDPTNHNVLLCGSHRVYKSVDNGVSYAPISGDLTTNPSTLLTFGTLTTLDISAANPSVYYAGTDDGKVWRSTNAGANWIDISAGLPVRWVTRVTADPSNAQVVYVTVSGFSMDEHVAHVYRSANQGATWTSVAGDLPDVPANDILVDPADPNRLFLATDVGVYASLNQGAHWFPLGSGMPIQTIFDLTFHAPSRTLIAATHGRSQWKIDLSTLPLAAGPSAAARALALSAPSPNPSSGVANLTLELPRAGRIAVEIYDASGRRVRELLRATLAAGRHPIAWDGRDGAGRRVAAGVYFVRAIGPESAATRRVVRAD